MTGDFPLAQQHGHAFQVGNARPVVLNVVHHVDIDPSLALCADVGRCGRVFAVLDRHHQPRPALFDAGNRHGGKVPRHHQIDRIGCARAFAQEYKVIVVLKGSRTVIAAPDGSAYVNSTGNPGMASGGMGDVLTGLIAGLNT